MTSPPVLDVLFSIDVEEDNWASVRDGVSIENVREIPAFALFLEALGVRATYFVNYQATIRPWAVEILRDATGEGTEIGAHLHPWNTPPLDAERRPGDTMLWNYSHAQQRAKLLCLTEMMGERFGVRPTSFRAGRFGLGPATVAALIENGYRVDSSVTPYMSWVRHDGGPSFVGAPLAPYRLDGDGDVRVPVPHGRLAEVPVSCGFTRGTVPRWDGFAALARRPLARAMRATGVLARSHMLRKIVLSPETADTRDTIALGTRLVESGISVVHMFMHATSLRPGLSPFTRSRGDVALIYERIARFLEAMARIRTLRFRTVGEVGREVLEPPREPSRTNGSSPEPQARRVPRLWRRSPRLVVLVGAGTAGAPGAAVPWEATLRALAERGWEIHVICGRRPAEDTLDHGLVVHTVSDRGPLLAGRMASKAREVIRRFEADATLSFGRRMSGLPGIAHVVASVDASADAAAEAARLDRLLREATRA